jgi:ABC-type protease/lipase transport system fused ATPase/permease subunit
MGRLLFPLLNRRDVLSLTHENLTNKVSATEEALSRAEVENMKATRRNQELAQTLLGLTNNAKSRRDDIDDEKLKDKLEVLERENKLRGTRRRILKNVVGSVIVGSGVDWASNEELCDLVMDDE